MPSRIATAPPIAMSRFRDSTDSPEWIGEQVDRVLGYEVLRKTLAGDPSNFTTTQLSEKIGVHRNYLRPIINKINLIDPPIHG